MFDQIIQVLAFTSIAVASFAASGILAVYFPPKRLMQSYLQHFAGGVVFAAVAVEVLPDIMHRNAPLAAAVGFALGVAVMLAVKALSMRLGGEGGGRRKEGEVVQRNAWSMVFVIAIDVLIDGLLVGAAFSAGQNLGGLLVLALSAEFLSLGPATALQLTRNAWPRKAAILGTLGVAALPWVGGLIGVVLLSGASDAVMEGALAFGSAAFLYLVTEELLVEAHEAAETPFATALFFVGFLGVLVLGMNVHGG